MIVELFQRNAPPCNAKCVYALDIQVIRSATFANSKDELPCQSRRTDIAAALLQSLSELFHAGLKLSQLRFAILTIGSRAFPSVENRIFA
jgi:hypothetical protein